MDDSEFLVDMLKRLLLGDLNRLASNLLRAHIGDWLLLLFCIIQLRCFSLKYCIIKVNRLIFEIHIM